MGRTLGCQNSVETRKGGRGRQCGETDHTTAERKPCTAGTIKGTPTKTETDTARPLAAAGGESYSTAGLELNGTGGNDHSTTRTTDAAARVGRRCGKNVAGCGDKTNKTHNPTPPPTFSAPCLRPEGLWSAGSLSCRENDETPRNQRHSLASWHCSGGWSLCSSLSPVFRRSCSTSETGRGYGYP